MPLTPGSGLSQFRTRRLRSCVFPARATITDRPLSHEFIDFFKLVDAAYPTHTAIRLILDNHFAHISKETNS